MADTEYDPSTDDVDGVNAHLAGADEQERARVLSAEAAGKNRKGIVEGPHADQSDPEELEPEPTGLAATGNPLDVAQLTEVTDSKIAHQEGAPADLIEAADKAEEQGFFGEPREDKPDLSQRNPEVMSTPSDKDQPEPEGSED